MFETSKTGNSSNGRLFLSSSLESLSTQANDSNDYHNFLSERTDRRTRKQLKDSMLFYTKYVSDRQRFHAKQSSVASLGADRDTTERQGQHILFPDTENTDNYRKFPGHSLTSHDSNKSIVHPKSFAFRTLGSDASIYRTKHKGYGMLRGHTFPTDIKTLGVDTRSPRHSPKVHPVVATDFTDMQRIDVSPHNSAIPNNAWVVSKSVSESEKKHIDEHKTEHTQLCNEFEQTKHSEKSADLLDMQLSGKIIPKHRKTKEARMSHRGKRLLYKPTKEDNKQTQEHIDIQSVNADTNNRKQVLIEQQSSNADDRINSQTISTETLKRALRTVQDMENKLNKTHIKLDKRSKKAQIKRLQMPQKQLSIIQEGDGENGDDGQRPDHISEETSELLLLSGIDITKQEETNDYYLQKEDAKREVLENLLQLTSKGIANGIRIEILPPINKEQKVQVKVTPRRSPSPSKRKKAMGDIRNKVKQRRNNVMRYV